MHTSRVTKKGQIVIPAPLRRKLGFDQGTEVVITESGDGLRVQRLDQTYFEQFAGLLSGEGRAADVLLDERKKERDRENRRAG